jgi:hypothetical protein
MADTSLSSTQILEALNNHTREVLGIDEVHFPRYLSTPAVSFDFRAPYLTKAGNVSKGLRSYRVTIWEDPIFPGRFSVHVNRVVPSGVSQNVLRDRAVSSSDLNDILVDLVP